MSGAKLLNEGAKQQFLKIAQFAKEMQSFAKEQLEQLEKDPRVDIDTMDRSKLYIATIKTHERSEANKNRFLQDSCKDKQDYMQDYQEYESSDDDIDIASQDFDSGAETDLRGRYGQYSLKNEMQHMASLQSGKLPEINLDMGQDISLFDDHEDDVSVHKTMQVLPAKPEPELKVPEECLPNNTNGVYRRSNWIPEEQ